MTAARAIDHWALEAEPHPRLHRYMCLVEDEERWRIRQIDDRRRRVEWLEMLDRELGSSLEDLYEWEARWRATRFDRLSLLWTMAPDVWEVHGLQADELRTYATNRADRSGWGHPAFDVYVAALKRLPYKDYLATPEWQDVRQLALERARGRCQLCFAARRLNVHHATYRNRGMEPLGDVIALCRACHGRHHSRHRLASAPA